MLHQERFLVENCDNVCDINLYKYCKLDLTILVSSVSAQILFIICPPLSELASPCMDICEIVKKTFSTDKNM